MDLARTRHQGPFCDARGEMTCLTLRRVGETLSVLALRVWGMVR